MELSSELKDVAMKAYWQSGGSIYATCSAVLAASGTVSLSDVEKAIQQTVESPDFWYTNMDTFAREVSKRLSTPAVQQPAPLTENQRASLREFESAMQEDVINPLVEKEREKLWGKPAPPQRYEHLVHCNASRSFRPGDARHGCICPVGWQPAHLKGCPCANCVAEALACDDPIAPTPAQADTRCGVGGGDAQSVGQCKSERNGRHQTVLGLMLPRHTRRSPRETGRGDAGQCDV